MNPKLSLVIAVKNEEPNIQPLLAHVESALGATAYELIIVDDGSTDGTIRELRKSQNPRLIVLELKKNYGQSLALMAGIDQARGEFIATMDGDLQNDATDLPRMLAIAEEGNFDMVAGNRANRKDGFILRKLPSWIANYIIRSSSGVHLKDYGCAIRVMRADLAKDLGLYGELHRFIPVLATLEGGKITQVDVKHHSRAFGKSKYGIGRTFKVMSDLLLMLFFKRYMQKPMHLFGNTGFVFIALGALINLYLLVWKLLGHDIWGRPLLLLGMILLIAGFQFITIGIVTELQIRTYFESQKKRPYKVRNVYQHQTESVPL